MHMCIYATCSCLLKSTFAATYSSQRQQARGCRGTGALCRDVRVPGLGWRGTGCTCRTASSFKYCAALAGRSTAPAAPLDMPGWHVAGWMEWEELTLRPAVYGGAPGPLEAALAHLDRYLASSEFLVGSAPTLADVVVFAGLLPLTIASATVRSRPRPHLGLLMPGIQWHACTGAMVGYVGLLPLNMTSRHSGGRQPEEQACCAVQEQTDQANTPCCRPYYPIPLSPAVKCARGLTCAPGVQGGPAQGRPVRAYLERMGQLPAVRAGMAAALGAGGLDALAAVFRRDAAAAADAQPRRPIPGARSLRATLRRPISTAAS